MPIIFSKDLSSTDLLRAYNDNVVEFYSNSIHDAISCDVLVNGITYNITPNNLNKFRYNLGGNESIFSTNVNLNDFKDDVLLLVNTADVDTLNISDNNGYKSLDITFTIHLSNDTTNAITKTYKVLRSVDAEQIKDNLVNTSLQLLQNNNKINYFQDYPNDISIFVPVGASYDVTTDNNTINVVFNQDTNRFTLSDGRHGIEDFVAIKDYDSLEIDNILNIDVKKIKGCGVYIKYLNSQNGWSYHLFQNGDKESIRTKSLGLLNNDYGDDNNNRFLSIGKSSANTIKAHSNGLDIYEMENLTDLLTSPKVFLFRGEKGVKVKETDFYAVDLKGSTEEIKSYKGSTFNLVVEITKPTNKRMSL